MGGVSAADALCASLFRTNGRAAYKSAGQAAGIASYHFTAWLSTPVSAAVTRVGSFGGCVENVRGQPLASTFSAFRSDDLERAPIVNEVGSNVDSMVFTATRSAGTFVSGDGDACRNWTSASASAKSVYGLTSKPDADWSADGMSTETCDNLFPIYCFG